jgi:hypothetical protein
MMAAWAWHIRDSLPCLMPSREYIVATLVMMFPNEA